MPLTAVTPEDIARELILLYGAPGSGKTRLATSLTPRFGKMAYIALEGMEPLASVLPQYRERMTIFNPTWDDPTIGAFEIPFTDWKKQGYDTLILDTFTELARKWLYYGTEKQKFQSKHKFIGEPGGKGYVVMPDKGDYGGVQAMIRNFAENLKARNPALNLILVCHEYIQKENIKQPDGTVVTHAVAGGPETVGKFAELPRMFNTIIRVDRTSSAMPIYTAKMAPHGIWVARRNENSSEGNKLKEMRLQNDPKNFWEKYDETSPLVQT